MLEQYWMLQIEGKSADHLLRELADHGMDWAENIR
jgi:hypothetical protein